MSKVLCCSISPNTIFHCPIIDHSMNALKHKFLDKQNHLILFMILEMKRSKSIKNVIFFVNFQLAPAAEAPAPAPEAPAPAPIHRKCSIFYINELKSIN